MKSFDGLPWGLWARDTFDREAPAKREHQGKDPLEGVYFLWTHVLNEGVLEDGKATFTSFSLHWEGAEPQGLRIPADSWDENLPLAKLKRWAALKNSHDPDNGPCRHLAQKLWHFWRSRKTWFQSYEAAEILLEELERIETDRELEAWTLSQ